MKHLIKIDETNCLGKKDLSPYISQNIKFLMISVKYNNVRKQESVKDLRSLRRTINYEHLIIQYIIES